MKQKQPYRICKNDILLAAGIALAAVILAVAFFVFRGRSDGTAVRITLDGREYGVYSLRDEQTLQIETERGHNTIVIRDGKAFMEEADCPDHYCISKGAVSETGETIVCLPHRLVVEIRSDTIGAFDAIAE